MKRLKILPVLTANINGVTENYIKITGPCETLVQPWSYYLAETTLVKLVLIKSKTIPARISG